MKEQQRAQLRSYSTDCLEACQHCIEVSQDLIARCEGTDIMECVEERVEASHVWNNCIRTCSQLIRFYEEHIRDHPDHAQQAHAFLATCVTTCRACVRACQDCLKVCQLSNQECFDSCISCVKACLQCAQACQGLIDSI
jgi:hypothetical protein